MAADALYILGDLFDEWVLPSDFSPAETTFEGIANCTENASVIAALQRLAQDNRLVYDHNYLDFEHYTVVSDTTLPAGPCVLGFEFEKTGEHQGMGRLFVNGENVGEGEISRTVPVTYGPEGLDIGRDSLTPVTDSLAVDCTVMLSP